VASSDRQFQPLGVASTPADWLLPPSLEIIPKAVFAVYDGSGAGSDFLPTLEIISDSGQHIADCPTDSAVVAGASATVSWFPGVKNAGNGADVDIQTFQLNAQGVSFHGGTHVLADSTPTLCAWGPVGTSDGTGVAFDSGIYDPGGLHLLMPIITDTTFTYVYSFMIKVFWPHFAGFRSVKLGISNPGTNLGWDLPCEVSGSDAVEDAVQTIAGEIFALDGAAPQFILVTLEQRSGAPQTLSTGAPSFESIIQMQAVGDTP
jgi:hypothetical protein